MTEARTDKARRLANRPYLTQVMKDTVYDGSTVYVAVNPELDGCIGQGDTIEEALHDLAEVRPKFILSLLEDNIPVPEPSRTSGSAFSGFSLFVTVDMQSLARQIEHLLPTSEAPSDQHVSSTVYKIDADSEVVEVSADIA